MSYCAYPDCGRPTFAKGWCKAHYHQAHRGQPMHPVGQRPPRPTCTVPGCQRPHKAKGLCVTHYDQARAGKTPGAIRPRRATRDTCAIDGCDRPTEAKGLCKPHYNRARYQSLQLAAPGQPACTVDGCGRIAKSGGLCNKHDCERRRRKAGMKPRTDRPARPRTQGRSPQREDRSALPAGWDRRAKAKRPSPTPKVLAAEISLRPITPEEAHGALLCLRRHGALDLAEALGLPTHPDGVAA